MEKYDEFFLEKPPGPDVPDFEQGDLLRTIFASVNYLTTVKGVRKILHTQGPAVRKEVSANPGLKVKLGFDFS